jgi:hypothetical protein
MCSIKDLSQKKSKLIVKLAVNKWEKSPSEGGLQAALDALIVSSKDYEE